MMTKVICGFPGVGKSTLFANRGDLKVVDSDSSKFDKAHFPANYIAHIKQKLAEGCLVLCSTHAAVRQAFVDEGIDFVLVYPKRECKSEYLSRYVSRGSPAPFVYMMDEKWDFFISDCESQKGCTHIILEPGEYIPSANSLSIL